MIETENTHAILTDILSELRRANRQDRLWSVEDIAEYFGLSRASVYSRIVSRSDFPRAVKIDGVGRRWKPADVRAYADRKRA